MFDPRVVNNQLSAFSSIYSRCEKD